MSRVRRNLLAGVGGIALAVLAASALAQASNEWGVYGGDYGNTRYSTLNQINTARAAYGLPALRLDSAISAVAQAHAGHG